MNVMQTIRSSVIAEALSPGSWVILSLALVTGLLTLLWPAKSSPGLEMWIFSPTHREMYTPTVERWGDTEGREAFTLRMFGIPALERRMMGGFYSGVEMADLIEAERAIIGPAFRGTVEDVGFLDLTDRLRDEGLLEQINTPSFGPWSSRGRIFGLPHDVHPVMLGYRADLIEAAGIDITQAKTWREFGEMLRPLIKDTDGDGRIDHWPLAFWPAHEDNLEVLLLQGGGSLFDGDGRLTMNSEINAQLLAEVVSWCVGPDRWCVDIAEFSNASNLQKIEGYALASFMPDWMCSIWKLQMGEKMAGKVKLMPLPAFAPGGRRTSVRGGSMLGIVKSSANPDEAWEFAKELYLSDEIARELYRKTDIITPIKSHWDDPIFDEPDPFFMGQAKGRMFIELAPDVPARTSSPYFRAARLELRNAAVALWEWSEKQGVYSPEELLPKAREILADRAALIQRDMDRNVFAPREPADD
ncbi:MAG: arabinosaccharide transport system substrate-binding protein [Phycisphaerales bacterium]|jgi:arabinosaccharide transport system substrate-binding protein